MDVQEKVLIQVNHTRHRIVGLGSAPLRVVGDGRMTHDVGGVGSHHIGEPCLLDGCHQVRVVATNGCGCREMPLPYSDTCVSACHIMM